jgi:hypothetical protein
MILTWPFIVRTLKRLKMVAAEIDAETLARELVARGCMSIPPYEYLSDVFDYLREIADPNAHPNGACRYCGKEIYRDSNAAIFCSNKCRQRAYRLRLKQRTGGRSVTSRRAVTLRTTQRRREP